jgi:hypothetical protein
MAGALAVAAAIAAAAFAVACRNCRRFRFVVSFIVGARAFRANASCLSA